MPPLEIGGASAHGELAVRGELGRGGMGVVHLAEQRSLGREVAVKRARTADPEVARALVREARVMGALEHPSLVPIHALGIAADGAPLLVMKRVEGVAWRELLREPDHPAWAPLLVGHGDRLRANVDVLVQLCRALAFAHERGVVHRDLKPDNVMIGRFGEVVLLDWGVALRLAERETEPEGIVGTPGYLAPEMARADPKRIDARTDVYLLGATLYEILSGRMPHEAPTALGALAAALTGEIAPLPEGVPIELAHLTRHAMALEPNERVASAEAFREGLVHFLASRDTDALVAEARAALGRANEAAARDGTSSATALLALTEARFGLSSALRMRPGDEAVRRLLDEVVGAMIEREIGLRSPTSARALLVELSSPSSALLAKIADLESSIANDVVSAEARQRERRDADSRTAVRPLTAAFVALAGVGQSIGWWYVWTMRGTGDGFPVRTAIVIDLAGVLTALFVFALLRRRLLATAGSRRLTYTYMLWGASLVLSDAVSYSLGDTVAEAGAHALCASAVVAAASAVRDLPELWPGVLSHALAITLVGAFPASSAAIVMPTLLLDIVLFVRAFRRHAARTAAAAS